MAAEYPYKNKHRTAGKRKHGTKRFHRSWNN